MTALRGCPDLVEGFPCKPGAIVPYSPFPPACDAAPRGGPAAQRWGGEGRRALPDMARDAFDLRGAPGTAEIGSSGRAFSDRPKVAILPQTGCNTQYESHR